MNVAESEITKIRNRIDNNECIMIRDLIPSKLEEDGWIVGIQRAFQGQEMIDLMANTLIHYAKEYQKHQSPEDLVDAFDLIVDIIQKNGLSANEFKLLGLERRHKYGSFRFGNMITSLDRMEGISVS